jgi:branched-chain amino acid transport system permease protein
MQVAVNGLITGLSIALLALGFTVTYLPTRVFHIALGGVYMSVPFVAWTCLSLGYPWPIAALAAFTSGVVLSVACEAFNHSYLERKGASSGVHLVSSLGIYIVIIQAITMIWGNQPKVLRVGVDSIFNVGGLVLTRAQVLAAVVSTILLAGFYTWLSFSNLGLQFRGLAENPVEMSLRGYSVRRLRLVSFGISGLLACASALVFAFDIGFDPNGGLTTLLLAVVAMIIGGRLSFIGPLVGGILLGLVRAEVSWFFSASWQEAATFILLAVFLMIRPEGLIGRKGRLEAEA